MNRYGEWNTGNKYTHKELLRAYEGMMNAQNLRIALSPYTQFKLTKNCYKGGSELDELGMTILAILGMGKCMTQAQLTMYLLLKGYSVDRDTVKERLCRYVEEGMVVAAAYFRTQEDKEPQVISYRVTYVISNLLQSLGAPPPDSREDYIAGAQMGRHLSMCACLMWNQVILNQLYYNNDVGSFRLKEMAMVQRRQCVSVPLGIFIKGRYCIFDILRSFHDPEKVNERLLMWENFAQYKEKSFVLVFLCESQEHEQWVASGMKDFASDWISPATCTEDRWLKTEPGRINMRNVVL